MEKILHQLIVVYPIIYKVFYIPGGAGFLPSTVHRSMTFHNVNCDKLDRTFPKICSNLSTEWLDARLNHPFEKYARQIGSFPQGRGENWKIRETTK